MRQRTDGRLGGSEGLGLRQVATRCDGVRCDMAMLVLEDVFCATWHDRSAAPPAHDAPGGDFWWNAIRAARDRYPDFLMIAEAYWDSEYRLHQLGFDYTYDKTLLDRLRWSPGEAVAGHLRADADYQRRSVRFLENHDEPRAATAFWARAPAVRDPRGGHGAGMLLLQDGQLDGARIRVPVELGRRPDEPPDPAAREFYDRLLAAIGGAAFRTGVSLRLEPRPTWDGDGTHAAFTAWLWAGPRRSYRLAVANLGTTAGRCFVPLALPELAGRSITLEDQLSDAPGTSVTGATWSIGGCTSSFRRTATTCSGSSATGSRPEPLAATWFDPGQRTGVEGAWGRASGPDALPLSGRIGRRTDRGADPARCRT